MAGVVVSWSGGKDAAWMLHELRRGGVTVHGLLTTIDAATERMPVHEVSRAALAAQAALAGLPIRFLPIPHPAPNGTYVELMRAAARDFRAEGATAIAFGDLYLADHVTFRSDMLSGTGVDPLFPLYPSNTTELAGRILDAGVEAEIVAVDVRRLPADLIGRTYDRSFISALPEGVDPCGEEGEFHSFVRSGPMLSGRYEGPLR